MPALSRASNVKSNRIERLASINILILISSPRAGDLIKRLFNNLGFTNLFLAHDAAEGIQAMREIRVHFIVTDAELTIQKPTTPIASNDSNHGTAIQLSGIKFVQRLRYAPSSPAPFVPILMLMDHARLDDVALARDAGVNEIVLKPLEALNFCERIIAMVDNPRPYITAETFRGPCRRRKKTVVPPATERRTREIRLVRRNE
jgi:DNA-binding response OmpR family regulator